MVFMVSARIPFSERVFEVAEAMGDHESGAIFSQFLERFLDEVFALRIDRAGRLVEEEDGRVFEKGAGHGEALTFAAAQSHVSLADFVVELSFESAYKIIGTGEAERLPQFLIARARLAEEEIAPHCRREEKGILGDVGNRGAGSPSYRILGAGRREGVRR